MARQEINLGTENAGDGEGIRDGGIKINENFVEVYNDIATNASNTQSNLNDLTGVIQDVATLNNELDAVIVDVTDHETRITDNESNISNLLDSNNFDLTHFVKTIPNITIINGSVYNILDGILDSEKIPVSETNNGAISVTNDAAGQDFILMNWRGVKEKISIRVTIRIAQAATDFFRLILKRKLDDTIISVHNIAMNAADNPDDIVTTNIETYVGSSTDSFVTDGFYIEFTNNSGQTITLLEYINILIERRTQKQVIQ